MKQHNKHMSAIIGSVITGLVLGMIAYVNKSVCMIAFNQPKQPDNIQKYLKMEDLL